MRSDGRLFSLTPRVLSLGWAYLSSLNLWEAAQPLMEELSERTNESCSAATLDLPDVVYVARMPTRRIMTISLGVGSRLPAHCTSIGPRPAGRPARTTSSTRSWPRPSSRPSPSTRSPTARACARRSTRVRAEGWAMVDQELEIGLRSIAAPLRVGGRTIAAHQPRGGRPARARRRAARRDAARAAAHRRAHLGRAGARAPARRVGRRGDCELMPAHAPGRSPTAKKRPTTGVRW